MFLCLAKLNALTSQLLKKMREDINGCSGGGKGKVMDNENDWNILVGNTEMLKGNAIFLVIDEYFLYVLLSLNNEFERSEGNIASKTFYRQQCFVYLLSVSLSNS